MSIKLSDKLNCNQRFQFSKINTHFFISNTRLKLAKNQAKAKQHPEVGLLLFENSLFSSILPSKIDKNDLMSTKTSVSVLMILCD